MKTLLLFILLLMIPFGNKAYAQSHEVKELLIAIAKYDNIKKSLDEIRKGISTLVNGYNKIKAVASGNYKLHELFLDKLMKVSPQIKNYRKIADIIACQKTIVQEYKEAFKFLKNSGKLKLNEIDYIEGVYSNLFNKSVEDIEELMIVITNGKAQMTDDQRLRTIDRIYEGVQDKLSFLRYFNGEASILINQRKNKEKELRLEKALFGIK